MSMAEVTANEVLAESTNNDSGWLHKCGVYLLGAQVHHSVHDSPIPLSGYGEVQIQTVPYCPNCHEKPAAHGAPIGPGDQDWPTVTIKEKANA